MRPKERASSSTVIVNHCYPHAWLVKINYLAKITRSCLFYVLLSLSWNYLVAVLFNIGLRYVVFWQFDRISWSYEHNFGTELNQTPTHLKYRALKTSPFTSCGSHPSMHLSCTVCGNNTVTLSQCALRRCIETLSDLLLSKGVFEYYHLSKFGNMPQFS